MAQLPNPNESRPYERYYDKQNPDGSEEHEYGVRRVDGHEELVHLQTGRSNMTYHQPEIVHDPHCVHEFILSGNRELECSRCFLTTTFHAGRNIAEEEGKTYVYLQGKKYLVIHL